MGEKILPTFILIGPGRSGTSWMYEVLKAHPEVCMAKNTKETLFFTTEYSNGLSWYSDFFTNKNNSTKAIGEIGNTYFYTEEVPQRIKSTLPDTTLITCLRNPIDRIISSYLYRKRAGQTTLSFEKCIKIQPDLISDNFLGTHLNRYLSHFDRSQINILFYDDLDSNPLSFAKKLYEIIGVDALFQPDIVNEKINQGAQAVVPGSERIFRIAADTLRKLGLFYILDSLKRNQSLRSIILKDVKKEDTIQIISDSIRKMLQAKFIPEIEMVEKITERDLSNWKH